MRSRIDRWRMLTGAVVTELRAENVTFMAGSIAYHAFVSLLPLLLLLLAVASLLGNQSVEQAIVDIADAMLSRGVGDALVAELTSSGRSTGLSVLGAGVLLWGTLRIFRGLDTAFSDIYETETRNDLVDQLVDGIVVLVAVALAIVAGGLLEDLVMAGDGWFDSLVGTLVVVAGLAVALFPMFYVFPDADVSAREVVPGTAFAAIGLALSESLFGLYVAFSRQSPESSIVAGVVVLLTWLYVSGLVVLIGAAINAVLANRSRDVDVAPVFGDAGAPDRPDPSVSREELVEIVAHLETLLEDHDEVTVDAGDDAITIASPTRVTRDAATDSLLARGQPVRIELQWTPARPGRDGEGAGPEVTTGDGSTDRDAATED